MARPYYGSRDWRDYKGLSFWFNGQNSGNEIQVELLDNRAPVADDFHLFAVEWEEGLVRWTIDETAFFTATRDALPTVKPGTKTDDWVYDHPFFLLMNLAVGGNFPGNPDDSTPFPAQMTVDYVRVYQAPDSAERFATRFVDNFNGWRKITIPFYRFVRSAGSTVRTQPVNAPNDGLTLSEVWGYSLNLAPGSNGLFLLDQIDGLKLDTVYVPILHK